MFRISACRHVSARLFQNSLSHPSPLHAPPFICTITHSSSYSFRHSLSLHRQPEQLEKPFNSFKQEKIKLFCIADGTSIAFPVDISLDAYVGDLKKIIKVEKSNDLSSIDADKLTLWRASIPSSPKKPISLSNLTSDEKTKMMLEELDPMKTITEIFGTDPQKGTIQIVVQPPIPGYSYNLSVKRHVQDAFPNGLPYVEPKPLLYSSGASWEYQLTPALRETLKAEIKEHYENHKAGRVDKITMPLYLFLSGAGTGKSRNASEFHRTAVECLDEEDEELKSRLRNAWVFHVSLENGSSMKPAESDPIVGIGSRMLHQLLPDHKLDIVINDYVAPLPLEVLQLVAKHKNQALEDATIILVVDAMQRLIPSYKDGLRADSLFYRTLTAIGDLAHLGAFLLPCCTATISRPIDQSLKASVRKRVYLPVASLETPKINQQPVFDPHSTLLKILEQDCGGHGRALELLWNLTRNLDLKRCNVGELMIKLKNKITELYRDALPKHKDAKAILQAVLTNQCLAQDEHVANTAKYPDQLVEPGLVRFEKSGIYGYFHVPYIWLWAMMGVGNDDPLFLDWQFDDYNDFLAEEDRTLPTGCSWENFEKLNMKIRSMKSFALEEGQSTSISKFHSGARLKGDIKFINHRLNAVCATKQLETKTEEINRNKWAIRSSKGRVDIREHKHIVFNAKSAQAGDVFLSLDAQPAVNEVHQYKLYTGNITIDQRKFDEEREKAASENDFFILFTTQKTQDIRLSGNSGIVDKKNWDSYFGPFAGRTFMYGTRGTPNINTADFTTLQLVNGVGEKSADNILEMRPFSNIDEAVDKTKIKRKILEHFAY